ncbi:MAG: OmpA family protein [Shimia sp.]
MIRWGVIALLAGPAGALTLDLPRGATLTAEQTAPGTYAVPTGPAEGAFVPTTLAGGLVSNRAWRVPAPGLRAAQLMTPLEAQARAEGYAPLLSCAARACGGFDFRFALDLTPPPDMFIDLGDFRVFAGVKGDDHLLIVTSRTPEAGYIQIVTISSEATAPTIATTAAAPSAIPSGAFAETLEGEGRVVLEDLRFERGRAALGDGPFASLASLAQYLRSFPQRDIALVGHTDSEGSLDGNIALSKARASAVRAALIERHGATAGQIRAEGMGYLAPRASNLTEAGRALNRRVEVIVTSTE